MSAPKTPVWPIYRRLLGYTRSYWPFLCAALLGMIIEAVAGGSFVQLMKPLTNNFVQPTAHDAVLLPLAIVGLFVLRSLATFVTDYGMARTGRSVVRDLREEVLAKYLRLPSTHFDTESTPVMVSRLNFDTEQVTQASSDALKAMVTDGLTIVYLLALMLMASVKVTLAMLLITPMIGVIVWYVGKRYRRISGGIQDGMGRMAASAEQSLAAQQDVKIHGAQAVETSRYSRLANRILGLNMKVESTRAGASALVQLLAALALAAIVWVAAREALDGKLDAGDFVMLMTAMMGIIPSLRRITSVQTAIARGVAAAERLFAILDTEEEQDRGTVSVARVRGELVFDKVCLQYRDQPGLALDDISFTARPGTVTAIVGRSGSGKTSLVRLVPRFYEPSGGRITLDGTDLADYRLSDLRQQIALVGQKVMLFDDTIAANIAYGAPADAAAIRAAAEAANAWEFIERLPQGMDTNIGENGALLSGGQRQRLAIARAILRDAPILILDEATAALDNESERLVQDALQRLMPERTTLVIAHRLSTIEHADQVLVFDHGRLVEQGTHAQLLAADGVYSHLHGMQFRERRPRMSRRSAKAPAWWYGEQPVPWPMRLLSVLYAGVVALRRGLYRRGWLRSRRVEVPVVVIGNLAAGGAGKTPLTLAVVERLRQAGWRPGVASRGYGRDTPGQARWVQPDTRPEEGGDEPVLIARRLPVPVRVDRDRAAAARALVESGCDIVVCDDGLQHYRLGRDIEIEVIDGSRRYGNGRMIPAGPLREPVARAGGCDFRVVNLGQAAAGDDTGFGEWPMRLRARSAAPLVGGRPLPLSAFAGRRVHAVAGIGHPQRFFDMLRGLDIGVVPHAFGDHHAFTAADLQFGNDLPVLMTEKDAVKCAPFADARCYAVPVDAELPAAFWIGLLERIGRPAA